MWDLYTPRLDKKTGYASRKPLSEKLSSEILTPCSTPALRKCHCVATINSIRIRIVDELEARVAPQNPLEDALADRPAHWLLAMINVSTVVSVNPDPISATPVRL